MASTATCTCDANLVTKKALLNNENNNTCKYSHFPNCDAAREKQLQNNDKKVHEMVMINEKTSETKPGVKWILQLSCVMYAMAFCGMVYGYTSPAFPSLVEPKIGIFKRLLLTSNVRLLVCVFILLLE